MGIKKAGGKSDRVRKEKKHPKLRFALKISLLLFLLAILAVLAVFYFKFGDDLLRWQSEAKHDVAASSTETFRSSETSFIYSSDKKVIAKLTGDKDLYYLNFDEIPQAVKDCFIVTEDRDFYEHEGVNFLSTMKAAVLLVKSRLNHESISRGGSTITQQLARKVYLTDDKTYERKVREMFYAMELEKKYTKDQILEFYINNVCFANAKYGIESASRAYFSRPTAELNLAEIAFLCAIPNRPEKYNPLEGYDNTIERKNRVLSQLLSEGKISEAEYSDASYTEIILDPAETVKTQDYMATYAISCATKALMEQHGFEFKYEFSDSTEQEEYEKEYEALYDECRTDLNTGGYHIYTSLSRSRQNKLQKKVNETLAGFKEKTDDGIFKLQGAATCIDNETGFVVAIVGGRKQKSTTGYTLNRAYQSYRQPGSCFKPVVVYTPSLERGYTPDSIVDDTRFKDGPRNSDNTYLGKIPLRRAVEKSKNVVAWRLFEELQPKVGLSYVLKMEFNNIVADDYYPASSLGGLTNGVTTVEMASAYATIENDGIFRRPTCIKKITDSDGNVILKNNGKKRKEKQVYDKNAARSMTDILTGVLTNGTGSGHALNNMACAGKTGTTSDKKDGWFCGFTPYFTTAVWVGYDSPKTLDSLYGNTYPLTIWESFMNELHEGLEYKDFVESEESDDKSRKDYDDDESSYSEPEETIEPDAAELDNVKTTKRPKETKEPKPVNTPNTEPAVTAPPTIDEPEDIPPDGSGDGPDDVGSDTGDDTE
ncbi:MAG: transglycosylase domain-containing protein [Lachnospiraceae bacterium]|nr:transglycosylase domain-containing protein [Lachnospiraceae bacterium]